MDSDHKKRALHIVTGASIILLIFLTLNYFLAKRLERYLHTELVERTSDATNGFYLLHFENLSINILNGELRLEGISLSPAPDVFEKWQENDSLPAVYIDTQIDLIDFKGVNLIWRRNYRHLNFRTFQIKKPVVRVVTTRKAVAATEPLPAQNSDKTLYEMISPYINVLSVKKMNLLNATVSYRLDNEESPVEYRLDDVTFHAYGFRLDKDSYSNGNLLYCNDFDFKTNQPQTLLTNNHIQFSTDTISLDTKRKVIHIGNAALTARKEFMDKKVTFRPENLMEGKIEMIRVEGIEFKRKDNQNSLIAGSFRIIHPDVKGYSVVHTDSVRPQKEKNGYINADSLIRRMSLYDIVSPIFQDIEINSIRLDDARLHYTMYVNDSTDVYSLDKFNFETRGFLIDSLASLSGFSRYYRFISLEATGMKGVISSRNQMVDLKKIAMNTEEERLYVEKLRLGALSKENRHHLFSGKVDTVSLEGMDFKQGIHARLFSISGVDLDYYHTPDTIMSLQMPRLALSGLGFDPDNRMIEMERLSMSSSAVRLHKTSKPSETTDIRFNQLDIIHFQGDEKGYQVDSVDFSMEHLFTVRDGKLQKGINDTLRLTAEGLSTDRKLKKYQVKDLGFQASHLAIPVDNGFYTLKIRQANLHKGNLTLDSLHYVSTYPQMQFSYKHPKHSDWFDITLAHLEMKEIDIPLLFRENLLKMKEATVDNMTLQNMKNQKIVLPRRKVPMIYEGLQKAPVQLDIPRVNVSNFAVVYYEWPRNGEIPGKLSITDVNGQVTGLTNIASHPQQFIRIEADAKFMGTGDFTAIWQMPVDPRHDQFLIDAHLPRFRLADLNPFITPLAGAKVNSGYVYNMNFSMDASSKEGTIQLRLPYRELSIDLGKLKEGAHSKNAFTSWLVNIALRSNNPPDPDDPDSKLRESHLTITRDPYHSTFNYLWQMLNPALMESVGIPEGTQKFGKGIGKAIKGIKNFFTGNKDAPINN